MGINRFLFFSLMIGTIILASSPQILAMEEEDKGETVHPLLRLQQKLQLKITSYTDVAKAISPVSRYFYGLSHEPSLNRIVRIEWGKAFEDFSNYPKNFCSAVKGLKIKTNYLRGHEKSYFINLFKAYSSLTHLDLSCPDRKRFGPKESSEIADALETSSTLKHLDLSGNKVGDEGGKALGAALKSNSTLTRVNLSITRMGTEGTSAVITALKFNSTLTHFCLNYAGISEDGAILIAEMLQTNTSLKRLKLFGNPIGDQGCAAIQNALANNTTLTSLDLGSCNIGDNGASAIAKGLLVNRSLTELSLDYNTIGDIGGMAIAEARETNKTLLTLSGQENMSTQEIELAKKRRLDMARDMTLYFYNK